MDKLQQLINHFSVDSEVIFHGDFCGDKTFNDNTAIDNHGFLHFLRSGKLTVRSTTGHIMTFDQPTIIVLPAVTEHKIIASETDNADLFCATLKFKGIEHQQLVAILPRLLCLSLDSVAMKNTVQWIFSEMDATGLGKTTIMNKLCDILLIQMFRQLAESGMVLQGMLAGLSHPALAKTLVMLHESPQQAWTVEMMAKHAAMSRSKFAALFRETIGQTPNDFLTDLRISHAQQLLQQDKSVAIVANSVGYEHGSALARVFRKKTGLSPRQWLQKLHSGQ